MSAIGKGFRGAGKVIKWLLILGALFVVVVVIAIIVSLGGAANDSEKSAAQVSSSDFRAIHNGDSRADVRDRLGKPENTDEATISGLGRSECWYYGTLAQKTYQLCFENGKVAYKSRY